MRLALRAFRRARLRSEFFAIRMVLGVVVVNIVVVVSAVSLKLRLKYFAASIGSAILFGTPIMTMTKIQL